MVMSLRIGFKINFCKLGGAPDRGVPVGGEGYNIIVLGGMVG